MHQSPSAHAWFLCALDSAIGPVQDVVIVGERHADDTRAMIKVLWDHYLPRVMILYRPTGDDDLLLTSLAPFIQNLKVKGGKTTAFICTGHTCSLPIADPHQMLALLGCVDSDT